MGIRDMTLFGAFTGGFRHYRGAIFIRGGDKSPLYRTQKRRFYNRIAVPKAKNIFGGLEKGKESHSAKFCFQGKFRFVELELIQTQMTQKPMLRAEVYARALRASQNRKEDSV